MLCHGSRVVVTVLQVSHPRLDYTGPDILVFTATTGILFAHLISRVTMTMLYITITITIITAPTLLLHLQPAGQD